MKNYRGVKQIVKGVASSDGDGVQLTRIIGSPYLNQLDPFLLLDAFGSDKPQDYIGGFPAHPHRGFETVTYMLAGKMRHKDSAGNEGVIEAGGVQWMTAGKGIIHSEMPEQDDGLLAGFQLWVNLPSAHKMDQPRYQEFSKESIPIEVRDDRCQVSVIAGETKLSTKGVIVNNFVKPIYWDVQLKTNGQFSDLIPSEYNAFIYVFEGSIGINSELNQNEETKVKAGQLVIFDKGDEVNIHALNNSRFLLIAGLPIGEPVERAGPFVMNTKDEIRKAFLDYQTGVLA